MTSRKKYEILLSISKDIARIRGKEDMLFIIHSTLRKYLRFADGCILRYNKERRTCRPYIYYAAEGRTRKDAFRRWLDLDYPVADDSVEDSLFPHVYSIESLIGIGGPQIDFMAEAGIREFVVIKLVEGNELTGLFVLLSERLNSFSVEDLDLLHNLAGQLSIATAHIIANEKITHQLIEINRYRQQLEEETVYLKEEIEVGRYPNGMIGTSPGIKKVFALVEQVARSVSSVLLLGETGTGKELIARAIHNASPRRGRLMVKVNCAALPPNLIESELFGHEKGSFTGASGRRIGKFELADKGTLFLDEIGEMPLELQAKLLRAIQEKEIERLGGSATIKVDVRIIAATNRDLEKMMEAGLFRNDLYYRLNIFPIHIPPLRERREDIPLLASHFIERCSKTTGKAIRGCSAKVLQQLEQYDWPGNIRELEHLMERNVVLAKTDTIREIDVPDLKAKMAGAGGKPEFEIKTIHENERDYIMAVLQHCNGRISGAGGASRLLGLPASTLNSRIKRLGIKKEYYS